MSGSIFGIVFSCYIVVGLHVFFEYVKERPVGFKRRDETGVGAIMKTAMSIPMWPLFIVAISDGETTELIKRVAVWLFAKR